MLSARLTNLEGGGPLSDDPARANVRRGTTTELQQIWMILMSAETTAVEHMPDMKVSVRQVFGIDLDMEVPAFSQASEHVPTSMPTICSTRIPPWRSSRGSRITAA